MSTQPTDDESQIRAAFENYCRSFGWSEGRLARWQVDDESLPPAVRGAYMIGSVQQMWQSWCAGAKWGTPATGGEPVCEPQEAITDDGWTEFVCPNPASYLMQCCDCGLIHEMQFRVVNYKHDESDDFTVVEDQNLQAQFRARRHVTDRAATARNDCKECDGTGMVAGSQTHFKCPVCPPADTPDEALIRQCMDALECAGAYTALIDDYSLAAIQDAFKACQTRLGGQHGTDA